MSPVTQHISKINQSAFCQVLLSACPISAPPSYEGIKLEHFLTWAQRNPFMSSVCWVTGTCLRLQGLLSSSKENSTWSISVWTEMIQEKMTHEYIRWRRYKHNIQGQNPKKHPEKDQKNHREKIINMQDNKIKIRLLKKRHCFFKWKQCTCLFLKCTPRYILVTKTGKNHGVLCVGRFSTKSLSRPLFSCPVVSQGPEAIHVHLFLYLLADCSSSAVMRMRPLIQSLFFLRSS